MSPFPVTLPLIDIPSDLLPQLRKRHPHLQLVRAALSAGKAAVTVNIDDLPRAEVPLGVAEKSRLVSVANDAHIDLDAAFAGLARAGLDHMLEAQARAEDAASAVAPPPFKDPREGQDDFYRSILSSLQAGRICLAEGSTGIGKSRAMVMAAIKLAEDGIKPVVIAAPTLKILGQLWEELETLRRDGLGTKVQAGYVPGQTEFVDANELREAVAPEKDGDTPKDVEVARWVAHGGPVVAKHALTRALAASGVELSFLMDDLREIATDVSPADFAAPDKDAHPAIRDLREFAAKSQIIFCTHSMLARNYQNKWAVFPIPGALLIDEAHDFERNFAALFADSISMNSLTRRLRQHWLATGSKPHSVAKKCLNAAQALRKSLRQLDDLDQRDSVALSPGLSAGIVLQIRNLHGIIQSTKLDDMKGVRGDRKALAAAVEICTPALHGSVADRLARRTIGWIEFSPDRRFPSIVAGRGDVSSILGGFWKSIQTNRGGIALASATLFLPDGRGNETPEYAVDVLALPRSKVDTPRPARAKWVTSIPVLHIPAPSSVPALCRPAAKGRTTESESGWLDALALRIASICESAAGGTVVLLSSFTHADEIAKRLPFHDRIVRQMRDRKLASALKEYEDVYRAGKRPVLLGLGGAWTGMDIHREDDDAILSDLIVACLPVGFNRSTTMQGRKAKFGIAPVAKEALTLLKQGIGRLVRSKFAKDKNLWILDGRIWLDWNGMGILTKGARQVLAEYKTVRKF